MQHRKIPSNLPTRTAAPPAELRALEIFDHLPPGCRLELVGDDDNAPHLRRGEYAVIDPADRRPVAGELHLIDWSTSRSISLLMFRVHKGIDGKDFTGAWFEPLAKVPVTSEGPFRLDRLGRYLAGRVVGVWAGVEPVSGAQLAPGGGNAA